MSDQETAPKGKVADLATELEINRDNPRLLEDKDGGRARCTDPQEYHTLTSAMGYRDITEADHQEQAEASGAGSADAAAPASAGSSASSGAASGTAPRSSGKSTPTTGTTAGSAAAGTAGDA